MRRELATNAPTVGASTASRAQNPAMESRALSAWSAAQIAAATGVHITRARAWKRGATIPKPMRKLLALVMDGDLGSISPAWSGWRLAHGQIVSPEGLPTAKRDLYALPFLRAQVATLQADRCIELQADWIDGQRVRPADYAPEEPARVSARERLAKVLPLNLTEETQHERKPRRAARERAR